MASQVVWIGFPIFCQEGKFPVSPRLSRNGVFLFFLEMRRGEEEKRNKLLQIVLKLVRVFWILET
jgi:hypothetical protein